MEMNERTRKEEFDGEKPFDQLSNEEFLDKLEKDISDENDERMKDDKEKNSELLGKPVTKKQAHRAGDVPNLKKENEELKQQLAELNDKYLRLFADFDNFRKRIQKERIEIIQAAGTEVISSLLPVLDDFQRALRQMEATSDPMTEGVKLIYQKFYSVLESKGLKAMKSIGEIFDPELHEAIGEVPVTDESKKGIVIDEIERGYYLNEKIIRHAKVLVGK